MKSITTFPFLVCFCIASFLIISCNNEPSQSADTIRTDSSNTKTPPSQVDTSGKNQDTFEIKMSKQELANLLSIDTIPQYVGKKSGERILVTGGAVPTRGYHNSRCPDCNGDPYPHECYDNWCFGVYKMSVAVQAGWHFVGKPFLHCVNNNQQSCEWNGNYGQSTIKIGQNTPRYIDAEVLVGSRNITVNLACYAEKD